ncbi:hypothetical protein ACFVIM_16370 [Streptomyces sp. NPDC057638]
MDDESAPDHDGPAEPPDQAPDGRPPDTESPLLRSLRARVREYNHRRWDR